MSAPESEYPTLSEWNAEQTAAREEAEAAKKPAGVACDECGEEMHWANLSTSPRQVRCPKCGYTGAKHAEVKT